MQTKLIKIDADDPNKEDMREAAEIIRSGGVKTDLCGKGTSFGQSVDCSYMQI